MLDIKLGQMYNILGWLLFYEHVLEQQGLVGIINPQSTGKAPSIMHLYYQ